MVSEPLNVVSYREIGAVIFPGHIGEMKKEEEKG
jgi:hypothetical protein